MWVLHSQPSGEHTSIGASSNDDSSVFQSIGLLVVENEFNVVHHGLLDSQVLQVVSIEGGITEWHALSIESVLTKENLGTELLGQSGGHEPRVVKESCDIALVTGIEDDWTSSIIVGVILQVSHLVGG
jgi:hypothetical protein